MTYPRRPRAAGDLGRYMHRVTTTHVRRWHQHRHSAGQGHLYQGSYKSFPIQDDRHFLTVCRYVERNARRADLVDRAEAWQWSSFWQRDHRELIHDLPVLTDWPVARPRHWRRLVNQPLNLKELKAIRESVRRGRPWGTEPWQQRTARRMELESTFRPRGRPRQD